jgi:hypothetical protein
MAEKMLLELVWEQLWSPAELQDLRTGSEVGEVAWHRRSGRKQRRHGGDGLPEDSSSGAWTKCTGKVLFYSHALRGGTAICAEGEQEVTARCGDRAGMLARATRRSGDVTVTAALRGGDVEDICPYAIGEEVS